MHSRFEETNINSGECTSIEKNAKQCYGGFARVASIVRQARNSTTPVLFLNAGDTFQGTPWYNFYKWKVAAKFMNMLKPDAMTLGNHEFDDGIEGLLPFLKNVTFPIVTSNLDLSGEPEIAALMERSIILNVAGRKIGIIGYLTSEPGIIPNMNTITILNEMKSIRKEISKLQKKNVNIIIGLGHSGYDVDKKIAEEVDGLDLIIGGHSHSFLYSGFTPNKENPLGPYPTEIVKKDGRRVYVAQAYAFTKYLGHLKIIFDADGRIRKIKGRPILLDSKINQAPDVVKEIKKMKPAVVRMGDEALGYTGVFLNGDRKICRQRECNLGNLITDAMINHNKEKYTDDKAWTDAAIAVYNSGNIRSSISKLRNQPITFSDVLTVLPFGDYMGKTKMTGQKLVEMLEHSAAEFRENFTQFSGQFLQYSGVQVTYNLSQPVGSRVILDTLYIQCARCKEPKYEKFNYKQVYTILVHDYLYNGGNNFNMFKTSHSTWINSGFTMDQILANHIKTIRHLINKGTERRIILLH
ncbi:protein 5NUC-like [Chelonus insularis]|uniref:protein 5NUC-like n=1 Tax=Chelonus insularis TaxID=460826 RepID=UPI00158C2258|nr:protein 5NUC-like [Chelonus insularis]